ncbi:MAG: cell wall hydrolase [Alphaproteobacteria bacterium]|nr:cell wall hydrolase [Alphaproteobacteria bacterium]
MSAALETLARTLYGEARGEGRAGIEAVAAVILNRARRGGWWGNDVAAVCRKPFQFSCWNADDPNRTRIEAVSESDPAFALCRRVAARALAGTLVDPTDGATHYHAAHLDPAPAWTRTLRATAVIGRHVFYRERTGP